MNVKLAEIVIELKTIYDQTDFFKEYITDELEEYSISINESDIEFERKLDIYHLSDKYLETLAIYRKVVNALIEKDILLIHGSCVCKDGVGYLFTAKSGTGKSTHTRLWRKVFKDCYMINDDKPLIRYKNNQFYIYGTPWNGKHKLSTNTCVPLKAICVLTRGEMNKIYPLDSNEAFINLYTQIYKMDDTDKVSKTFELINKIMEKVSLYKLECNMEDDAAIVSYEGMKE